MAVNNSNTISDEKSQKDLDVFEDVEMHKPVRDATIGRYQLRCFRRLLLILGKGNEESLPRDGEAADPILTKSLILKQDLRIVPISAATYLLCYLDRSNIGERAVLKSTLVL